MASALLGGSLTEVDDTLSTLKHQFLASLNHEIRTPLSSIMGITDLLLETRLDAEQQEFVTTARVCAQDLLRILNATLEYSALSAGGLRLEETEFDPADIVAGVLAEFTPRAEEKGLQLFWRPQPPLPEVVVGDAMRFRQLLSCLVDNAVKFTTLGRVEVGLGVDPGGTSHAQMSVSVRDTGAGIAPERIREIFESFRQLSGGLARTHAGLGLGLAIAQKLAEMMGGEIRVASDPGRGSCFSFHAPFRLPAQPAFLPAGEAAPARNDYCVLVVEDNLIARKVVTHVLTRSGYRVECAETGLEAIEAAGRAAYDLVLMDLQMPGIDGLEATAAIRALPGYAATPVIAFTANSFSETRALCREHGMQGFLSKPVNASELLGTIRQFLP
jgi:CheY-like chemotaxis protein